jgi:hypothetical protein
VLIVVATAPVAPARAGDPEPQLPTMADLKEMYDAGAYRTCLQQVSRLMQLRSDNANAVNRDQLLLLRGQCLLAMDDAPSALRSLDQAKDATDLEVSTHARALAALIRRSPGLRYVPKSHDAGSTIPADGINIADPKTRKDAFRALMHDEFNSFQADARKAIAANNLEPTIALVPQLVELSTAERVATGSNERMKPISMQVGEHARDLIGKELEVQDKKITNIEKYANQLLNTGGGGGGGQWWGGGITRQGLNSEQRQSLYDLIQYLQRIVDTSQNARKVAASVGGDVQAWDAVVTRSQAVRDHAQQVLDAEGYRSGTGNTSGIGANG